MNSANCNVLLAVLLVEFMPCAFLWYHAAHKY
ncbi:hypothetical protein T07_9719 [Trichinella nelsoni]|uniref:Uncharacterized protein n=1 Tax=Trichinella nelsoni TaxID=6336 RepID=A0A0V0RBB4_9BILA|nr:hypothetical protein T07_9719 [Trichinella nelsoni]